MGIVPGGISINTDFQGFRQLILHKKEQRGT